jgi:hypothetical protein
MNRKTLTLWAALLLLLPVVSLAQARKPNPNPNQPGYASNFEATDSIEDGSFEAGTPNAFWNETSTNFGTPLCDAGSCGTGGGTAGPNTGAWWSWFGGAGTGVFETGTVDQDVTLTDGNTVVLEYFLWIGVDGNAGGDTLEVDVDGNNQQTIFSDDGAFSAGYAMSSVDISSFADGGTHNLLVRGGQSTNGNTNFNLDDLSLVITAPPPPPPGPPAIPTLSPLGLILLVGLMAAAALLVMRRRRTV